MSLDNVTTIEKEPKQALLISMAIRYQHDFTFDSYEILGLTMGFTPHTRKLLIEKLRSVYTLIFNKYVKFQESIATIPVKAEYEVLISITALLNEIDETDVLTEIASGKAPGMLTSASQIYEEVSGEGFYSDKNANVFNVTIES